MVPLEIEPANFRLVTQCLSQLRERVPPYSSNGTKLRTMGANIFSSAHFSASENALSMWKKYVNDKADNEESTQNTNAQRRS